MVISFYICKLRQIAFLVDVLFCKSYSRMLYVRTEDEYLKIQKFVQTYQDVDDVLNLS